MKPRMSQRIQFSLAYLLVAVIVLSFLQSWLLAPRTVEIPMSKFLELLKADQIEKVAVTEREIAQVPVKNHANGARNPLAHFREAITLEAAHYLSVWDVKFSPDGGDVSVRVRVEDRTVVSAVTFSRTPSGASSTARRNDVSASASRNSTATGANLSWNWKMPPWPASG